MQVSIKGLKRGVKKIVSGKYFIEYQRQCTFNERYAIAVDYVKEHNCPDLSCEDKRNIDEFWKQYGLKFPDYSWHRMFYAVTGNHDPMFVPDPVMGVLFPYYNRPQYVSGLDDKNMYDTVCPSVKFPQALCHIVRGQLYDGEWNHIERSRIEEFAIAILNDLGEDSSIIVKRAMGTFAGQGVKKYNVDKESFQKLLNDLLDDHADFIVQKCIRQHPFLAQFNESSVNIFRINTLRIRGKIVVLSVSLRFGEKGSATDICFRDGKEIMNTVGIDKNGFLMRKRASFDGLDDWDNWSGERVPEYNAVIDAAKIAHKRLYQFDFVGWDFTLSEDSNPICIEYNVMWPGSLLYQFASGPLLGEYTDEFLQPLKQDWIRKGIPSKYRL